MIRNNNDMDFLTIDKVAEILHVSKQKVNALIRSGELKVLLIDPRSRRIAKSELERFIGENS